MFVRRQSASGRREAVVTLACIALIAAVVVAAALDRRSKGVRASRAERAEWHCRHDATNCGGPSSAAIEAGWERREVVYLVALVAAGGAGAAWFALRRRIAA